MADLSAHLPREMRILWGWVHLSAYFPREMRILGRRHETAGDTLAHPTVGAGDDDGVDRLDPAVEGCVDVVDGAGQEQPTHRRESDVAVEAGGRDRVGDHRICVRGDLLVVGHGVRDRPRDRSGVAEVGYARHAGEGQPGHVELRRRQPHLLVDPRRLEHPVRVGGDHRRAGGGA
ncbi:hypothetical protein ON003_09950 [Janibacter hoylei]|nr:hypothetical protein [Janibacter hoylei]MCW4601888.1 hypothetical protein [Janibacter hoylei]